MRHFAALLLTLCCLCASVSATAAEAPLAFVQRKGRTLVADGKLLPLVGINRYELAGGPQAASCQHWGGDAVWWRWATGIIDQTEAMGGNVIRLWVFQNYAGPSGKDFSALDRVIAHAKKRGVRIIPVLTNNWADCDKGGIKTADWYAKGWKARYGYPLSFADYVRAIVGRYRDEPAIAMWQVVNEGKAYENPSVLRRFLVDVTTLIKSIDKKHLVSGGAALQCWQAEAGAKDFRAYNDDGHIDVLDLHDYDEEGIAYPKCLQRAMEVAKSLNKPLIIGESGVRANAYSPDTKASLFDAKIKAAVSHGASGYLIWQLNLPGEPNYDQFDFYGKEKTAQVLSRAAALWTVPKRPLPQPAQTE